MLTSLALSLGLTLVIEVPFIAKAFGFTPIGLMEYGIAIVLAFLVIPVVEIVKLIQRSIKK
jgi:Ca2+-transporting ATPase